MDNPLFVNECKSTGDLSRPSTYFSKDSRVSGFCWSCFWLIEDLTPQASFALFHYQDHSCGACFLEKGCAVKLNNVRMLQFSDEQNQKHAICINVMQIGYISINCQKHFFLILVFCLPLTRERNETQYLTIWSQKPATKQKAQVVYKEETVEFCYSKTSARH